METKKPYQDVVNRIISMIDTGIYAVGDKLPNERHLAAELNVGRGIIRNAKAVLQAQGRIENRTGSGSFVLAKSNQMKAVLPNIGEIELSAARASFEAEAAALAAVYISDEIVDELQGYIHVMSGKIRSEMTPDEADRAFHIAIARATENDAISIFVESLWNMRDQPENTLNLRGTIGDIDFQDRIDEHQAIFEALKNRDSAGARRAMQTHCEQVREKFSQAS